MQGAPPEPADETSGVVMWHGAWFAAAAFAALAWPPGSGGSSPNLALGITSLAGAAGLVLGWRRASWARTLLLIIWTATAAAAAILGGGLAGPTSALCLTPLAAALVLGGGVSVASGAALSLTALAACGLAGAASGAAPAPRPWFFAFVLALSLTGLAAALALAERRAATARARLAAADQRSRDLLSRQGFLILDLDPIGGVRESFGALPPEVTPSPPAQRVASLATEPKIIAQALGEARAEGHAEAAFTLVGENPCVVAMTLTSDENGFVATLRDATAERAREALLAREAREADARNEGKSRFLANMSHELRTPLNAVIGFSDIMRGQMFGPLAPKYVEYAQLIHESGGHLLDLINDVLDISKIDAERYELSLETFDVRETVAAAMRLTRIQADASQIRMRGALGAEPVWVNADRRAIKQIVLNLISNALKFTPPGGMVTVGLRAADGAMELAVGDTGVGVAPEDLPRLGRPFEQAGAAEQKAQGSGLGLSLVRALSERHGGSMSIQSTLGEGTVVVIQLPVLAPSPAGAAPAHAAPEAEEEFGDNVIVFPPGR